MIVRLTRCQIHSRHQRAKRNIKIKQYLLDRQKLPMVPLPKTIADELGDIEANTPVTMSEFQRCLRRLEDIRSGRIKKSNKNEKLNAKFQRIGRQNAN